MYNKIPSPEKRKNLNYISIIKFWAMLILIKWHVYKWEKIEIDYGARMCELLFIASGFLVGYNYYQREMPNTFTASFKYAYKHLRTFYPIEFFIVIYGIVKSKKKFKRDDIEVIVLNLLIMKAWSRHTRMASCINSISWFLSALTFCYFLTPFLLGGIRSIKNSLLLFIIVAYIRITIEVFIKKGSINMLDIHFHRGPVLRSLDFYLGMLTIPTFFKSKEYLDKIKDKFLFRILFTIIQILSPFFIYKIMLKYNFILYRCHFIMIFCGFIFIFGFDYGYISNIASIKLVKIIMSCQMEMYQLQIIIYTNFENLKKKYKFGLPANSEYDYFIKLIIIFIIAFTYKKLFKERFARLIDKIVNIIKFIFK